MKLGFVLFSLLIAINVFAIDLPILKAFPEGVDKNLNRLNKTKVLVFLSKTCPCTQQNIPYINELAATFPEFEFVGIHSVKNSTQKDVEELKQNYKAQFTVLNDPDLKMANTLKANRTPQTFILANNNDVLYNGGVSDRTNPYSAKKLYLKNALNELNNRLAITEKETRSLGCIILR